MYHDTVVLHARFARSSHAMFAELASQGSLAWQPSQGLSLIPITFYNN